MNTPYMRVHQDIYIFACEVYNNTTSVKYFSMDVDLYDANGNLIGSDNSFAYISIIHPQKSTCIDVMFENLPNFDYLENYGNYQETDERKPSLSISKHSGSPDSYGDYETLGIITNNTASTVNNVNAIASLSTGNGFIVDCDFGYINADPLHLAPGQQRSFYIST